MANYYCVYCGVSYTSIQGLTAQHCFKHPNGQYKGNHVLYEGGEKSQYTCKYCGEKHSSIQALTSLNCTRHPNGMNKGFHSPAL